MPKIIIASLDHPHNVVSFENGYQTKKYSKMCLGHEIHMTRYVLIDMIINHHISKEEDIVVTLKDRKFLYHSFIKCIDVDEFYAMNKNGYEIINLSLITGSDIPVTRYSIYNNYQYKIMEKFYTEEFKTLLNNIDYCPINYEEKGGDKDYILIHHRYDLQIEPLKQMISKINNLVKDMNIVIFNHNLSYLQPILEKEFTNLIFIENLQIYASYLNQKKCKLFISEWSGGGQLSHYCYEGKIIYYFHTYNDYHYIGQEKEMCKQSIETDMIKCWDFKHSRDIDINLFDSITNIINNLEEYIPSNLKQI